MSGYVGLGSRLIWTSRSHFVSTYGPVPTSRLPRSLPESAIDLGEIMIPGLVARTDGRATHGAARRNTTVVGSVTSMAVMGSTKLLVTSDPRWRSTLTLTASPSIGVPSWNVTPGRSSIVHDRRSGASVSDSASPGSTSSVTGSRRISVSATAPMIVEAAVFVVATGSSVLGSAESATVRRPPGTGVGRAVVEGAVVAPPVAPVVAAVSPVAPAVVVASPVAGVASSSSSPPEQAAARSARARQPVARRRITGGVPSTRARRPQASGMNRPTMVSVTTGFPSRSAHSVS